MNDTCLIIKMKHSPTEVKIKIRMRLKIPRSEYVSNENVTRKMEAKGTELENTAVMFPVHNEKRGHREFTTNNAYWNPVNQRKSLNNLRNKLAQMVVIKGISRHFKNKHIDKSKQTMERKMWRTIINDFLEEVS